MTARIRLSDDLSATRWPEARDPTPLSVTTPNGRFHLGEGVISVLPILSEGCSGGGSSSRPASAATAAATDEERVLTAADYEAMLAETSTDPYKVRHLAGLVDGFGLFPTNTTTASVHGSPARRHVAELNRMLRLYRPTGPIGPPPSLRYTVDDVTSHAVDQLTANPPPFSIRGVVAPSAFGFVTPASYDLRYNYEAFRRALQPNAVLIDEFERASSRFYTTTDTVTDESKAAGRIRAAIVAILARPPCMNDNCVWLRSGDRDKLPLCLPPVFYRFPSSASEFVDYMARARHYADLLATPAVHFIGDDLANPLPTQYLRLCLLCILQAQAQLVDEAAQTVVRDHSADAPLAGVTLPNCELVELDDDIDVESVDVHCPITYVPFGARIVRVVHVTDLLGRIARDIYSNAVVCAQLQYTTTAP